MADTILPAIFPNAGIQALYEQKLKALVDELQADVLFVVRAAYAVREPQPRFNLAMDASPAGTLRAAFEALRRRWSKKLRDLAPKMAGKFVVDEQSTRVEIIPNGPAADADVQDGDRIMAVN